MCSAYLQEQNGTGNNAFTAFVEIVFDNSDERIPLKRNEVRISRTFGPNKDEFHVDGKRQQYVRWVNFLELIVLPTFTKLRAIDHVLSSLQKRRGSLSP